MYARVMTSSPKTGSAETAIAEWPQHISAFKGKGLVAGIARDAEPPSPHLISLSCVFVSKSLASWRSCSCWAGSPEVRLTIRPRFTAGRSAIIFVQRMT